MILVADDEPNIRSLVVDYLVNEGLCPIAAADGREALDAFALHQTSIRAAILDVMMPVVDGWSVLRRIRETSSIPILMLTARGEEPDELMGFSLGATDYVTKPFRPRVLIARLRATLAHSAGGASQVAAAGGETDPIRVERTSRRVYIDGGEVFLTPREYELLAYLAASPERAYSREQLLDAVWGYSYVGDTRTVDTHIKQLRAKLGVHGDRIETARGFGYRLRDARL